ncbi:MAG: hypothetical protein ACI9BW_002410 [Gammaproteobacteria bacterium]|jgi:uncharacterized protein (TIGR02118 family)
MITMIVFVRRVHTFSREEFTRYWHDQHGPLVMRTPEFMQYVHKYVQHHYAPGHAAAGSLFGDITDYDGVGEIWFDSRESMNTAFNEPRYLEIIKPDERTFIDIDKCLSFISEEHVMIDKIASK